MQNTVVIDYLTFELSAEENSYTVVYCEEEADRVVIPKEINGLPVMGIGEGAFRGCLGLTEVVFPEIDIVGALVSGLSFEIDDSAFRRCISLTEVTIPDGVTRIGWAAFAECFNLRSITIPVGTFVSSYVFTNCGKLEVVSDLSVISEGVFSDCTALKHLPLGADVTEISESAFEYCTSLTDVVIPARINRIEALAFEGCYSLESVRFEEPEGWYLSSSYHPDKEFPLDLTSPEKNAKDLGSMDFDDGVIAWYRK